MFATYIPLSFLDPATAVAFQAYNVYDTSPSSGSTVRFTSTLINKGGGYSTSTGYFTAKQSGTYSFSAKICICTRNNMRFDIIVGSTIYATGYAYDQYAYACATAQAVAALKVNDKVFVRWQTYSYSRAVLYNGGNYRNSFSGVYLFP